MKLSKWNICKMAICVALPALVFCCVSGGPIRGKVVEDGTNQPIAGALVQVTWTGAVSGWVHTADVCMHESVAITSADGSFRIPAWSRSPTDYEGHAYKIKDVNISRRIYKPGYEFSWETRLRAYDLPFSVKRFSGDSNARLAALAQFAEPCLGDGSEKETIPLLQAILEESRSIPGSNHIPTNVHPMPGQDYYLNLPRDVQQEICRITGQESIDKCLEQ